MIRFLKLWQILKPNSAAWRTAFLLGIVVLISQYLSIAFFWTNLYLPELKQHAHYTAVHIRLLEDVESKKLSKTDMAETAEWVKKISGIEVVHDASEFPQVVSKPFTELFTDEYRKQMSIELGQNVNVYFKFKPQPVAWIHIDSMPDVWLKEPIRFFDQYNPYIIIGWVIGVPLLTIIAIIILVRQLNRPLRRLQIAALKIGKDQTPPVLETQHGPSEIREVNRAFNQMTREIQQASKERSFMLAGISHDLRTPLTRLRLTAELLKDKDISEGMILDIQDMDDILDQFIAYMRDGSDEPIEQANLNLLISEEVAKFQQMGRVEFSPHESIPDMPMKRLSLKRMIDNIVNNALRYGGAPVLIHTHYVADKKKVEIVFRDHGPGVNEADIPQLLQPFQRGESARTTQGSGLGLAIVARIVKMHNGELHITNHAEGGLLVTITLPENKRPSKV